MTNDQTNQAAWPDLAAFQGLSIRQAIQRLIPLGYAPLDVGPGCRIFRDAPGSHLMTLSPVPVLAEAFSTACAQNPPNPHLPKLFESRTLGPALHIRVTENLNACTDFPVDTHKTICGLARAFSSLFAGDDIHINVHPELCKNEPLLDAVHRVIACGEGVNDPARTGALAVRIENRGHSVMFRPDSNEPVYASPLVPARQSLKTSYQRLQLVKTRFTPEEMANPDSVYWPKIPVQKAA